MLIFIPPSHFKDDSLNMARLFFDKWGIDYVISSYTSHKCVGSQGSVQIPEINTNNVVVSNYDGILLIGGEGIKKYKLNEFRPFLDILLKFNNGKKHICAIGNSVQIIAKSNIIKNKKIAGIAEKESRDLVLLFRGIPSNEPFEISDNVITISDNEYSHLENGMIALMSHLGVK